MNAPASSVQKHTLHPLLIAAAIAVVLFCAVGIAAMMGVLPSSIGGNHNGALSASDQAAVDSSSNAAAVQGPNAPAAAMAPEPAPASMPVADNTPPPEHVCHSCGVVESVHEITTRAAGSGVGAAGGAVVGGLLGNQVGSGNGRSLATIAGAIGGAVAGNQIEGKVNAKHSYNVTVRLEDGKVRTFHQSSPDWRSGDHVRIVNGELRSNG
ncbi:MAG TPA: glycine zipper 2TM domain-containing protein [Janthinobacterium sp.]|jgi:outer membrane lipoprotein SlyB|nr:glycine zipper 2TM domain-containing protein [Janthinobacterium sp.]